MLNESELRLLDQAITARSQRRGLLADLGRLRYANGYIYGRRRRGAAQTVLYAGVGHGLDALLALLDGDAERIIGVDPYHAEEGSDDSDYLTLQQLIATCGLARQFELHRCTLDEYRWEPGNRIDRIVFNDVLHHIFVTRQALIRSPLFSDATRLFTHLHAAAAAQTQLVVGDVMRHGLRPLLARAGIIHSCIKYPTKQDWQEWDAAAKAGGWRRRSVINYLPYRLRRLQAVCAGPLARYLICDRYYLTYDWTLR